MVDAESTRRDLAEHLGTPAAKVDVVPLGVTSAPDVEATGAAELRGAATASASGPVVLSVSAKRPHKNLARLLARRRVDPARAPARAR